MNVIEQIFKDKDYDIINNIVRWNGLPRIKDETVGHHTFMVIWFGRVLVEYIVPADDYKTKLQCIDAFTFHDFDEFLTGDILHQVKYNSFNGEDIREALSNFIYHSTITKFNTDEKFDVMMKTNILSNSYYTKKIVKLADWLSALFYIRKEINMGNKMMLEVYENCYRNFAVACRDFVSFASNNKELFKGWNIEFVEELQTVDFAKLI